MENGGSAFAEQSAVKPARPKADSGGGRRVAGRHSFFLQIPCRALGVTK